MLELARRNAAEAGATNVEFLKGRIEAIPLPDASVDVVISNCVINLSTDKAAVLAEIARVLRPGGRIGVSDVVADDSLSPAERASRGSFAGCIAGALSFAEYRAGLDAIGLVDVEVTPTNAAADGLHSAIIRATKPAGWSASVDPAGQPSGPRGRAAGPRPPQGAAAGPAAAEGMSSSALTGKGSAIGSVARRLRPSASKRSRPSSRTSISAVVPRIARSAATRATPGPHIMPWPPADATVRPSIGPTVRRQARAEDRQVVGRVVDGRRPDPCAGRGPG